jgi:hypothetical protein
MAKKQNGVNKSEEIRQLLKANPEMAVKDIVATMTSRGLKVTDNLVYFIKGKMRGRTARRQKARQMVASVTPTMGNNDAVATILKVKRWGTEVGGMKKLKALVDALSE